MSPLLYEGRAHAALGDVENARTIAAASLGLRRDAFTSAADIFLAIGRELRAHGRAPDAEWFFERCVAILGPTPANASREERLIRLRALYEASRWDDLRHALRHSPSDEDPDWIGMAAAIAAHEGDQTRARAGIAALRKLTGKFRFGRHLMWAARVAAVLGDVEDALTFMHGAFARGHGHGIDLHTDRDLMLLRR